MISISEEQRRFLKLKIKIEITKLKIKFLKKCKKNGLKPAFIQVKTSVNNNRTEAVRVMAEKMWLKLEIRHHYASLTDMERTAYELHLRLTRYTLTAADQRQWVKFDTVMNVIVSRTAYKKRKVLDNKYDNLKSLAENRRGEANERIVDTRIDGFIQNFSSVILTPEEDELLNKGLKFCIPTTLPPFEEIIVDVMASVDRFTDEVQDEINEAALKSIKTLKQKSMPNENASKMMNIARALKKKPIVIAKADKSNNVVIMDKDDYDHRMNTLIADGGYEKLDRDPLGPMVNKVNDVLKKYGDLMCENPRRELRKWKNSNPKIPRLYGHAKTHKLSDLNDPDGLKMRPVASNIDSPTEKISKWLVKEFRKLKPPKGKSVKNAIEFMRIVKNEVVRRTETMGSYDAVSLFPSIPINETMLILRKWLMNNNVTGRRAEMYIELTKLCMDQNVFTYNGEFYIQRDGTAIGNSLSSFIAELYMCDFETKIENNPAFPRVYVRFVDDIFTIQNARQVGRTLQLFNGQHPRVQFTYEGAKENKIPFLDTLVTNMNGRLVFDVYRKPCATKRVITFDSNHDIRHKMASFHSMAHRLVKFPLENEAYDRERATILDIGKINGYNEQSIERIIRKHERKEHLLEYSTFYGLPRESLNDNDVVRVSMVYLPQITRVLRPIYRNNNVEIVHRSGNSIRQNLASLKDKIPEVHKSGIYMIKCQPTCMYRYIGRTLRRPTIRFGEHMDDWVNDNVEGSAVAVHMLENGHEIDSDYLSLIKPYSDKMRIDSMEAVYLHKHKHLPLMNKNLGKASPLLVLIEPVREGRHEAT